MESMLSFIPKPDVMHIKVKGITEIEKLHPYALKDEHMFGERFYPEEEEIEEMEAKGIAFCTTCEQLVKEGRQRRMAPLSYTASWMKARR